MSDGADQECLYFSQFSSCPLTTFISTVTFQSAVNKMTLECLCRRSLRTSLKRLCRRVSQWCLLVWSSLPISSTRLWNKKDMKTTIEDTLSTTHLAPWVSSFHLSTSYRTIVEKWWITNLSRVLHDAIAILATCLTVPFHSHCWTGNTVVRYYIA